MSKKQKTNITHQQTKTAVVDKPKSTFKSFDFLTVAGILFLTFFCFSSMKSYEFVNWDDDRNFYENKWIINLNKDNFWQYSKEIFKLDNHVIGGYNPLSIWTFALEKRIHGKGSYNGLTEPGKWHMTNLYLHFICIIFTFMIARRLKLSTIAAGFVALLFAIHPMRVESVAWVTERKDVLFGAFYLAAIYQYIRYKEKASLFKLISILLFFVLSLFSKIQAVSLPLSLIAIDYLMEDRFHFGMIKSKWFYFLFSLAFGLIGVFLLKDEGSLETNSTTFALWQRPFIGSYSFCVYLMKLIIPYEMSPLYPYPSKLTSAFYLSIIIAPLTLYALWLGYKKNWKVLVFALIFFIVNIAFLLQILAAGQGFIADRFTYIAYFGFFLAAGFLLDHFYKNKSYGIGAIGAAVIICVVYSFMTFNQVKIWENSGSLWTHVLKYYDKTTLPFGNRANYYRGKKMYKEALADYNSAISLQPGAQTYNSRARLYFDTAGSDTATIKLALADYNDAIKLLPKDGEFWINRGATYARLGNLEKALENINQGLIYKPDHAEGYLNRSVLNSIMAGKFIAGSQEFVQYNTKAIADIDEYIKLKPYNPDMWFEKAKLKRSLNKIQESIPDFDQAIKIDASKGHYFYERALTHFELGNKAQAKSDMQMSINLKFNGVPEIQNKILSN